MSRQLRHPSTRLHSLYEGRECRAACAYVTLAQIEEASLTAIRRDVQTLSREIAALREQLQRRG